ncbi:MAG: ECF-type sigma factor [Gemmatimonadales bacterium]
MPPSPRAIPAATPRDSLDRLMPKVYDDLRVIARRQLAMRAGGGTLSTTGLVHEAYLKLANQSSISWKERGHFLALSSLAMRHVLVDRARARLSQKRGAGPRPVTLDDERIPANQQAELLIDLHEAIERLGKVEPRLAEVIDYKFFGGFSDDEVAEALGVTRRTVQRDWAKARMLLRRAMET